MFVKGGEWFIWWLWSQCLVANRVCWSPDWEGVGGDWGRRKSLKISTYLDGWKLCTTHNDKTSYIPTDKSDHWQDFPINDYFCVVVVTGINCHQKDNRFSVFVVTNKYNTSTGLDKRHTNTSTGLDHCKHLGLYSVTWYGTSSFVDATWGQWAFHIYLCFYLLERLVIFCRNRTILSK